MILSQAIFDFSGVSPEDFMDPTDTTREVFDQTVDALPFRGNRHRSVEVQYGHDDSRYRVGAHVSEEFDPDGNLANSHIGMDVREGEEQSFFVSKRSMDHLTDDQKSIAQKAVLELAEGLPEEESTWLTAAWAEIQNEDTAMEAHVVDQLLGTSPYDVEEHVNEFAHLHDSKGNDIGSDRTIATPGFLRGMAEMGMAVKTLYVTYNGKRFEYHQFPDNRETLVITDPRQEVKREAPEPPEPIEGSEGGLTFSVRGTPDFMNAVRATRAAYREARQRGLDAVTEAKMKELTAAIQAIQADA